MSILKSRVKVILLKHVPRPRPKSRLKYVGLCKTEWNMFSIIDSTCSRQAEELSSLIWQLRGVT